MNKQCIWCCRIPCQQEHQSCGKQFLKTRPAELIKSIRAHAISVALTTIHRWKQLDGSFNYRAVNISVLHFRRHLTDGVVLLILFLVATAFCCFRLLFADRAGAVVCEHRHRDYCHYVGVQEYIIRTKRRVQQCVQRFLSAGFR